MNRKLVGSIYGRSSIKTAHFVPIHIQTWAPQAILVSDWLISKESKESSVTALPNESKLGRKHHWKVIYEKCAFSSHPLINMAATGHSCFWLVENLLLCNFLAKWTKTWWEAPMPGYGRFCIKFPQSRMKGERHRLSPLSSSFSIWSSLWVIDGPL